MNNIVETGHAAVAVFVVDIGLVVTVVFLMGTDLNLHGLGDVLVAGVTHAVVQAVLVGVFHGVIYDGFEVVPRESVLEPVLRSFCDVLAGNVGWDIETRSVDFLRLVVGDRHHVGYPPLRGVLFPRMLVGRRARLVGDVRVGIHIAVELVEDAGARIALQGLVALLDGVLGLVLLCESA